jgi:hypothetical protein
MSVSTSISGRSPTNLSHIREWRIALTQLTGIFKNSSTNSPDHIDNCDGNQALWVFALPDVALFQDYDSIDWHNQPPAHQFNAIFKPGKSYRPHGGCNRHRRRNARGATLDLSLYYRDSESNQITVGLTTLTNTPTVFSNNTTWWIAGLMCHP